MPDLKRLTILMAYAAHEYYVAHRESEQVRMSQFWHTGDKVYQELRTKARELSKEAGLPDDFIDEGSNYLGGNYRLPVEP